uniref:Uncharacterized protein n=1 Tax=Tanacetum cinerariifolium TaxID=118510 RepID=A0A6L2P872_TANCI|nr:hypothetical protein [Tanacetum cinerariifolium]
MICDLTHIIGEKVTIADLSYLHNMDGGIIARYFGLMSGNALNVVTRGHDTALYDIVKLEDLRIIRSRMRGGLRRRPSMSFTNRLRVMDDRLGEIDQSINGLANEVEKLTQRGVDFMSGPHTAPSSSTTPEADSFGLFGQLENMSSSFRQFGNGMDEE